MGRILGGKSVPRAARMKGETVPVTELSPDICMAISLPACNGLPVSASFVKTEVFTSPYKKICQTQNHDFFP